MAVQSVRVPVDGSTATWTFNFNKPVGNYIKGAGLTITPTGGDSSGTVPNFVGADVDNHDGTMTGTIKLGDPTVVGTVEVTIVDTP